MPHTNRSSLMMFSVVAALTLCGGAASTQDEVQPTNDLPNPYQSIAPWENSLREGLGEPLMPSTLIATANPSGLPSDAVRIPIPHLARQRSSTTAALVQLSRRSR